MYIQFILSPFAFCPPHGKKAGATILSTRLSSKEAMQKEGTTKNHECDAHIKLFPCVLCYTHTFNESSCPENQETATGVDATTTFNFCGNKF